jgi:hypothetical protein
MYRRAKKAVARIATQLRDRGGFRQGSGRKSLFPGKLDSRSVQLTQVAIDAAKQKANDLTGKKPHITTAHGVKVVTFSDAVEYCIRRATQTPLEDRPLSSISIRGK